MGKLTELLGRLEPPQRIILSGPYGTEVAERMAKDMADRPQMATGVLVNPFIGHGCSALFTNEGREYLRNIAHDYLTSVPSEQVLILVTPTFRIQKQILETATFIKGVDPTLPRIGLELCLDAIELCLDTMHSSGRSRDNTLLAMSIGPPIDCYRGEDTPPDIYNKTLPQTFAAIRFGHELDYIMFETVPSLNAAIGAARAFKKAHDELDVPERLDRRQRVGTLEYMRRILPFEAKVQRSYATDLCPSYDPTTQRFAAIEPEKDYVISFCLEKDCTIQVGNERHHTMPLNVAISKLYATIKREKLYAPAGLKINCNSPKVEEEALSSLSPQNLRRLIGIHPNASSERDPRKYGQMTRAQAIEIKDYAAAVKELAERFNLRIVGGCCGTNERTMKALYRALSR